MDKPNVLIIAQDTGIQEQLKNILAEEYDHLGALNGIDGVAISRMARPAVLIVDANISQPKAVGICKSLSGYEDIGMIPVVLLADTADVTGEFSGFPNFGGVIQQPLQVEQVRSKIKEAIEAKAKGGAKAGPKRDEPIQVLSVDDSSVVRKLVTMILTAEGFKVATASDGLDGINKAKELKPDIILLDFVMPKMNGFQVCRVLQKDETLKQIPVILVTSKGDKVGDKFVNQLGVTGYITKPFQPEELVSKIHQTLEAPKEEEIIAPEAPAPAPKPAAPSPKPKEQPAPAAAAPAVPRPAAEVPADSIKQIVQEVLAKDFEEKIHELVKTELSKFMKSLDKRIEKQVIEKMNEYIRRAKKK